MEALEFLSAEKKNCVTNNLHHAIAWCYFG